tara:strand:- start:17179 stop:20313 length:3135 start_codon:yes stop_codon:yes gene_type:complete
MPHTVKKSCTFNPLVHNYRASQGVEKLTDLISEQGDGEGFFQRNFVTKGMEQLFREGFLRLAGKSDDGVFLLQQAMGGGKTHLMVALGLLAKHPNLRRSVLPDELAERVSDLGSVKVAAFNGRNDPENFLWGEIGDQLGITAQMKKFWQDGPKRIGQQDWLDMLSGQPSLIMLDELPPYLLGAKTTSVGGGSLLDLTIYNLGNLMSAALELPNVMVVITNLESAYGEETKAIASAIETLNNEAKRQARNITPVELSGGEIYQIIKKRLIDELPSDDIISAVADAYAQEIKKAERSGFVRHASLEQVTEQVKETYPFHPSFKHIVALFKENPTFRQTRGLMQFAARMIKSVIERENDDVCLIGAQHLDMNIDEVSDEIRSIAKDLQPAITHDLYDNGNAIAEQINAELESDLGTQVGSLLLASSLSRSVNARRGLTESELVEFLAAPGLAQDGISSALNMFKERGWYVHREDERYFIRETENLSRKIERIAKDLPENKIDDAFINHMRGALEPVSKKAYQQLYVMPKMDEIDLRGDRVLIVLKPDGRTPPENLGNFFEYTENKNNFFVLSGGDTHMANNVDDRLREMYATEQVLSTLKPGDSLYDEAQERLNDAKNRFASAVAHAYNKLYYPNVNHEDKPTLFDATIDAGLKLGNNNEAEKQIEDLLSSMRCDEKLNLKVIDDDAWLSVWSMAEEDLWQGGQRRTPWRDVLMRARQKTEWGWLPGGKRGMERMKEAALRQGRWRFGDDGYIEKGPFPKESTGLNIVVNETDFDTQTTTLQLTPVNAGNAPVIYYSESSDVDESCEKVTDPDNFKTGSGTLYFIVVDSNKEHDTGEPVKWTASLSLKHQPKSAGTKRLIEIKSSVAADIRYTLDGSNAREGAPYDAPIEIGQEAITVYVFAKSGDAECRKEFSVPAVNTGGDTSVDITIDDAKPAKLNLNEKVNLDSTGKTFEVLNKHKDSADTFFAGVRVIVGDGNDAINLRFGDREVTAKTILNSIEGLREAIGNADENVIVKIQSYIKFDTGFNMKTFAEDVSIALTSNFTQE